MDFKDKKLIIFDFDGTLINSIPDLTLAANKLLAHYELPSLTIEEVTPFIGNGAQPLVRRVLEKSMSKLITDEFLKEALEIYIAAYSEVACEKTYLYEGVLDTLNYLQNKGYKMVICTNKPSRFIEPILDKLSLKEFFNEWIGEDSLPEKKPSAAPLLYLADAADCKIDDCVMIGDSKNDILAAQNAQMESIGLTYGYNYNENIADFNPTVVLDQFADLQELF